MEPTYYSEEEWYIEDPMVISKLQPFEQTQTFDDEIPSNTESGFNDDFNTFSNDKQPETNALSPEIPSLAAHQGFEDIIGIGEITGISEIENVDEAENEIENIQEPIVTQHEGEEIETENVRESIDTEKLKETFMLEDTTEPPFNPTESEVPINQNASGNVPLDGSPIDTGNSIDDISIETNERKRKNSTDEEAKPHKINKVMKDFVKVSNLVKEDGKLQYYARIRNHMRHQQRIRGYVQLHLGKPAQLANPSDISVIDNYFEKNDSTFSSASPDQKKATTNMLWTSIMLKNNL
ncbi:hypothetical protein AVEN_261809-1 [Araneus ventricosus]|uniref:Uncharacterized protein n=1 Tax=Araneus ventricosus TaxID=182803 RepID=A0A4Y2M219_ARAVE|nr:hypothetical protein AVEN_261809-1 [Araneus ventricosus]